MNTRFMMGLSIGYLLIPNLLFFFYWTRPIVAIIGICILLYVFIRQLTDVKLFSERALSGKDLVYVSIIAFLLTILSGITGICCYILDGWAHNTKFFDLYTHDWPLKMPENGPALSYYFGYYLVPVLLSKLIGELNEGVIFLWTFLGLFLGVAWIYLMLNTKIIYVLMCFTLGEAPLVIGIFAKRFKIELYEFNNFVIELRSFSRILPSVPNQVIPILIIGGMLFYLLKNGGELENLVLPISLSFWWGVFPSLAMGLLVGILILNKWAHSHFHLKWNDIISRVILPCVACLPVLLLFESHNEVPISGFIWNFGAPVNVFKEYFINVGINTSLFLLAYRIVRKPGSSIPEFPFYLTICLQLIIPLYRMGEYNDFILIGLHPYLTIIGLYILEPLSDESTYLSALRLARSSFFNFVVVYLFLFSTFLPLKRIKTALKENIVRERLFPGSVRFKPFPYDAYPNIYEMLKEKYSPLGANEYLGKRGSIYEDYIRNIE